MKRFGLNLLVLSLPAIVAAFPYSMANAALRIDNSSLNSKRAQLQAAAAAAAMPAQPQPARTVTNDSGERITVSNDQMSACEAIYPNGRFDWLKPTSGFQKSGPATCVAEIELRSYYNGGATYTVLAHTYLAAGDGMKCNIDEFPQANITMNGRDFTYPADEPPTIEETARVMAQENKANAGWKILGAAIVGGLGGNLVGLNDPDKDSALGVSKDKMIATAVGAAGAAGLMTASTQVNDYKAGSVILSTGMNAAAGAVVGNLMATGDDVIRVGPCKIGTTDKFNKTCVYGSVEVSAGGEYNPGKATKDYSDSCKSGGHDRGLFYAYGGEYMGLWECEYCGSDTDGYRNCKQKTGLQIDKFVGKSDEQKIECKSNEEGYKNIKGLDAEICKFEKMRDNGYCFKIHKNSSASGTTDPFALKRDGNISCTARDNVMFKIAQANNAGSRKTAFVEVPEKVKFKGYKEWSELQKDIPEQSRTVYGSDGNVLQINGKSASFDQFTPAWQSADDSDNVDFSNKARTKSTLIGAGGGAALGALSGAAGAEAEIQERFVAAVREYEDSLGNIACSTGDRWLSKYNDTFIIPEMKTQQ